MKMIKAVLAILAISFSLNAMAITDDESVEFTGACNDGNLKIVKKYVEHGLNVNELYFGWSPLQMASTKGHLDIVKYLIAHGADVNYTHPVSKMASFHLAAFDNYPEIVKYLASKGANVNQHMKGDVSLIRIMRDEGNTKMVDLLLSLGVKDDGCEDKCF